MEILMGQGQTTLEETVEGEGGCVAGVEPTVRSSDGGQAVAAAVAAAGSTSGATSWPGRRGFDNAGVGRQKKRERENSIR
jgi:hypothetical protein